MKKTAVTFMIIALSAIPLMAQQNVANETELKADGLKESMAMMAAPLALATHAAAVKPSKQGKLRGLSPEMLINHTLIKDGLNNLIETDPENSDKYSTLLKNYDFFIDVLQRDEFADHRHREQAVSHALDILAKAVNALPTEELKTKYNKLLGTALFVIKTEGIAANVTYIYNHYDPQITRPVWQEVTDENGNTIKTPLRHEEISAIATSPMLNEEEKHIVISKKK